MSECQYDEFVAIDRPLTGSEMADLYSRLPCRLIELFHCDSEEFWFPDGHLLLRGDHGAGKSCRLAAQNTPYRVSCSLPDFQ